MANISYKWALWLALSACMGTTAGARGVSPYLPLNVSLAIERDYERVLLLAGKPVMRRPVQAAVVLDALPKVCSIDRQLCERVRASLSRYQRDARVTSLSVELAAAGGDSDRALPNAHGRTTQSNWQVAGTAYYQPSDYLLLNAGGIAYDSRTGATGTMLSAGFDFAQLDIGFRDHWLSPLSTSSMLISTEAPTMPSVTVSNYQPISPLGITYEVFAAQMSKQDGIAYFGGTTSGSPHLAGLQLGIEPVPGYALTVNRVMQYGGGARGGGGIKNFIDALWHNSNQPDQAGKQEEFGNQVASVASSIQFPGDVPFAINIEYAGEDNSYGGSYRLGDDALSLGIDFPRLWQRFDLQYEISEWQNVWYTHHLYPDGLTQNGFVIGHWFGDQRQFGDRVGGGSQELRLGVRSNNGGYWQGTYRTLGFVSSVGYQTLPAVPYRRHHELALRYSNAWHGHDVSGGISIGRDVFGDKFGRLNASVDLAGGTKTADWSGEDVEHAPADGQVDFFVDAGVNHSRLRPIISLQGPADWLPATNDYHVGVGVRRPVSRRSAIGVRLELDGVEGGNLISLRAVDYRYKITSSMAVSAFVGVGRYDDGAPAFGWYGGLGLQYINVLPKWDMGLDWRYYDKMSRNRVLPNDPPYDPERPRLHFDVEGQSLYVSRRF
jgi:Capsule assembly protein Wzi